MANTTDLTYRNNSVALVPTAEQDDPALIREQIDHTRVQMGSTIQAISERLSPENLIEQAKTSAKEATVGRINDMKHEANRRVEGASSSLSQTIRDNPLPVAVIGLGLGWLLMSERKKSDMDAYRMGDYRRQSDRYQYYGDSEYYGGNESRPLADAREYAGEAAAAVEQKASQLKNRVGQAVHEATDAVEDAAKRTGEAVSDTASQVGERVGRTAERVGETTEMMQDRAGQAAETARNEAMRLRREAEMRSRRAAMRTKESFWENMNDNPLAVGAVLAIAGAAIGAVIPTTEYENKLMGETRDRLLDEAKERAQDVVERVQTVVDDTQRAVVTEVKEAAREQNLTLDGMAKADKSPYTSTPNATTTSKI